MRTIVRAFLLAWSLLSFCIAAFLQKIDKKIPKTVLPLSITRHAALVFATSSTRDRQLTFFFHGVGERDNCPSHVYDAAINSFLNRLPLNDNMRSITCGQIFSFVTAYPQPGRSYDYSLVFYVKEIPGYAKTGLPIRAGNVDIAGVSPRKVLSVVSDTYVFNHRFDGGIGATAPVCGIWQKNNHRLNNYGYMVVCGTPGSRHTVIDMACRQTIGPDKDKFVII